MFFSTEVNKILDDIKSGKTNALRRRRNKKKANGFSAYDKYISCKTNISLITRLIVENKEGFSSTALSLILVNMALQFIYQKESIEITTRNIVSEYIQGNIDIGLWKPLIDDLIGDRVHICESVNLDSSVFSEMAVYIEGEDTLGCAYISLLNIGTRKASGAYYTPLSVVSKLVTHLANATSISGKTVFDPCCGSGNFLLSIGDYTDTPELIYGQDIDSIAVKLARINFALKYNITDYSFLCTHFVCADTLVASPLESYDIILGNPPWGGEIAKERLAALAGDYKTAVQNGVESYALFVERGLSLLRNGFLSFVLPEAVLNVATHTQIRSIIMGCCSFRFVRFLGNVFSGVQCPSVILCVEKTTNKTAGIDSVYLEKSDVCYKIHSNRQITEERFNFRVRDEHQDCLDALNECSGTSFLSGNAVFALGIVTGDNESYMSGECLDGYEPVLKGSDIMKYRFKASGNYLRFIPQNFQQVAPMGMYRAPEKLLYRFICETLVFAYDNEQFLSLNSCNILIPQVPNMCIKYILAVLNSRVANFYFINMFNSIKVLRSHIEQIPIPIATSCEQEQVTAMVNRLIYDDVDLSKIYDELDDFIMGLYNLGSLARQTICSSLANRNLFLF